MTRSPFRFARLCLLAGLLAFPAAAWSHGAADSNTQLHVGTEFDTCYFDLHPTLTQSEFSRFAGAIGSVLRFPQLAAGNTLGRGNFDLGISYSYALIDDADDAWNDTFTHPDDEHYLGTTMAIPRLQLRAGVTESMDVGVWLSFNPVSNFGIFGFETRNALLQVSEGMPVDLGLRGSLGFLVGPEDLTVFNLSADLTVSRSWYGVAPYLGLGLSLTVAMEHADDVQLDHAATPGVVGFGGLEYRWAHLSLAAQAEITTAGIPSFSARLSAVF